MTEQERPDPDALLASIQREEAKEQRGRLKIFFGMAAGVGKTYAMLEAAHHRNEQGVDVVIGYLEPHGRKETQDKAIGLETVPPKRIDYKGVSLFETDVPAILARKPQLVLVDELAHTNAPGSTHPKRYMDVLDLLDAGLDVYTTVNVQHLESRSDAVEQITGVTIHETIPDTLIDNANEIELIDLEPDELLKRLSEGKIYSAERAQAASDKFFRKGNLTALREMALRLTAERVDHQLQDYMTTKLIAGPWKSSERLMVAVSPSPLSERLIRWTRRMAYNLEAPWIAVYVERSSPLSDEAKSQLAHNLALVQALDGEVITTPGDDLVQALLRTAHQRNVTQIVVGKPVHSRWREMVSGGSLVNQLVRTSGDIDIYVVNGDETQSTTRPQIPLPKVHSSLNQYIFAISVIVIAVIIGLIVESVPSLRAVADYQSVGVVLIMVVVILANFVGRGPILVAAALSAILWDFGFIPPRFTFAINTSQDILLFALNFIVGFIAGNLNAKSRSQRDLAQQREERMSSLYTLANEVAEASTLDDVLRISVEQVSEVFQSKVAFYLPAPNGQLSSEAHPASTLALDVKGYGIASYAFERNAVAGKFTDTLSAGAEQYYLPLVTPGGVTGVMIVDMSEIDNLSTDQDILLKTFTNHIALAVERELLDMRAQQNAVIEESEKLYAALLDSISHELRTPLTTITGATSGLSDPAMRDDPVVRAALSEEIQDAADRLNRLVENLLDMSRIQAGRITPKLDWCDITDLVNVSLKQVEKEMKERNLVVDIAPDLPLMRLDFSLMERVMVNLLHNAVMYTPPAARIRLTARREDKELVLSVADRGAGLPPEFLEHAFDKFSRAPGSKAGGTGLGLSICKALVEAQGGTISAENRPTHGGARFTIRLPIEQPARPVQEAVIQ